MRKHYIHLITTGVFGVADKIKAFRKPFVKNNKRKK